MRLLIVRHGDPDYEHDTLTEKGWREATLLADYLKNERIDEAYVSTMGRASDTASLTLEKKGMTPVYCDWLREFSHPVFRPDKPKGEKATECWDWLPADWTVRECLYDKDRWAEDPVMAEGNIGAYYEEVARELDKVLANHGYVREGNLYRVEKESRETLAFFCHFGVTCVLLGHLLGISPMPLWHGLTAAPTSVTEVFTEERRPGIASFRASKIGDTSHLYIGGEPVSKSARFRECAGNADERVD